MCSRYGVEGYEASKERRPGETSVRFCPIVPMDRPEGRALMRDWAAANGGDARITGRNARNLNPVIHALQGERELSLAWWWLHVDGAPAAYSAFNSRDDKLLRSWRAPFQHRGLLPANWYIEKGKRFALPKEECFGIAAILAPAPASGTAISYSMVTREAVGEARSAHHRMPLVLPRELHDEWLDPSRRGDEELVQRAILASNRISLALEIVEPPDARPDEDDEPTLF